MGNRGLRKGREGKEMEGRGVVGRGNRGCMEREGRKGRQEAVGWWGGEEVVRKSGVGNKSGEREKVS